MKLRKISYRTVVLNSWYSIDVAVRVAAGALLLAALPMRADATVPTRGGVLTVGITYDVDTLNVYVTAALGDIEAAVVEGLVAPDEHAHYVPVLATQVPTLDNGGIALTHQGAAMRVTYHLRPGVLWQDGVPLSSADVKFTWEAVRDPTFLAESKDGTEEIESIDTPDPGTVVVNYRTVSPAFASTLFTFGILPKHLLDGKDLNHDSYSDKPLGTGPFRVSEFRRGQYVVLERNPLYWGRDAAGATLPYLDRIIFYIIPNSNTLGTLIRAGEVQFAPRIPVMLAKQLRGAPGIELLTGPSLGWAYLDFSFKRVPALRDPRVRRAIAQAINRTALVKAAGNYPHPIYSSVLPVFEDLYDPQRDAAVPEYDPAAANAALDAAGFVRAANGIRRRDGQPLELGITTQSGDIDGEIAEQILMAQLKAIGIAAYADNKSGIAYRQARYKGAFDLQYGHIFTAADPVYSMFYGTHGPLNGRGYSSAAMDAALARMETSLLPEERRTASAEVQRILARDLPTVPLLNYVSIVAKTERLHGYVANPTNMTDFVSVAHWWLEAASHP